jgi:hypothetical protein
VADAHLEAELDLGTGLVVAVKVDALRRKGGELTAATSSDRPSSATSSHIARQLKALLA